MFTAFQASSEADGTSEADPGGGGGGGGGFWGLQPPLSYMVTPPLLLNSPSPFPAFCIGPEALTPPPPAFRIGPEADSTPPPPPHFVSRVSTPPFGKPVSAPEPMRERCIKRDGSVCCAAMVISLVCHPVILFSRPLHMKR